MSGTDFGRAWTLQEDTILKRLRASGTQWARVSSVLGRTPDACAARISKLKSYENRGIDPYAVKRGPEPAKKPSSLPRPFDEPGGNVVGCQKLHEAHMRVHGGWKVAA